MNDQADAPQDKARTRRLAIAAAAMFVVAGGVFGRLFLLQRQAMQSGVAQQMAAGRRYYQAPDITVQQKVEIIARAKWIRERWRTWALNHKAELTEMLRAKPNDQAALMKAWNKLPYAPRERGLTPQELCPSGDPFVGVGFTWEPPYRVTSLEEQVKDLKPEVQKVMLQGELAGAAWRRERFADIRDIVVADSLTPGHTHVQLWASGRITQQTALPAKDRDSIIRRVRTLNRPFQASDFYGPHREIVPPFEFLPQTTSTQTNYVKETLP